MTRSKLGRGEGVKESRRRGLGGQGGAERGAGRAGKDEVKGMKNE